MCVFNKRNKEKDLNELSISLPVGKKFFRYDLGTDLPHVWSTDYHSVEYSYVRGYKNICGAFFFYDNKDTALDVLTLARKRKDISPNTITSCHLIKEVSLLDFSKYESPAQLLSNLYNHGINVFGKGFCRYGNGPEDDVLIDTLKEDFETIIHTKKQTLNDFSMIIEKTTKINDFFYTRYLKGCECRYIGQLFTDFDNGPLFKQMLIQSGSYGYCFRESPTGLTYCLFDSDVLSSPTQEQVNAK